MIPVIDVFAGPGGLGEGFSSFRSNSGEGFRLVASFEKDPVAHATLRFRAFCRSFDSLPHACELFQRGEIGWAQLCDAYPGESKLAEAEARHVTLGPETARAVRKDISAVLPSDDRWILVGGPPCQAYSLAGRSRNKGIASYRPEQDARQTLYVEYLQILADHAPPVFVMENVKGLLSATVNSLGMFERIREDLRNPAKALKREGRSGARSPRYTIRPLFPSVSLSGDIFGDDPTDYLVKSELFGVPQRRHRVILVGVRDDVPGVVKTLLPRHSLPTVAKAIKRLPSLRSGLSKETDSEEEWIAHVRAMPKQAWMRELPTDVRAAARDAAGRCERFRDGRGSDYLKRAGRVIFNHSTRSHILPDLERYFFASVFASVYNRSPRLSEFPEGLLPNHLNVKNALGHGLFSDRFRVQLANSPSTTVTSHISKDGHYYIHYDPSQCRSLTVREAAELQTFPPDYFFCGPRTAQYHQVGNAVPPMLAEQIAGAVAPLLGL